MHNWTYNRGLPVKSLPRGKFFMSKFFVYTHTTGAPSPRHVKHLRHQSQEVKKSCNQLHVLPHFVPKSRSRHLLLWQFPQCQGNEEWLENALTFSDFPHCQGGIYNSRITHQSNNAKSSNRPWQTNWLVLCPQPIKTILNTSIHPLSSQATSGYPGILEFGPQEAEICSLPYHAICTHLPSHHHIAI